MDLAENIKQLRNEIPSHVKIIAVSKTHPAFEILQLYDLGQRLFGENRAQELIDKQPTLPLDIKWHFIGHLQSNKVKFIAPYVSMVHSVDSLKLLLEINKEANKCKRLISCLLQFHIATEETKYGLDSQEAEELLGVVKSKQLKNIVISGVMGMATFTENMELVRQEFQQLRKIFHLLKKKYFENEPSFCEISMGMSSDYMLAIEEGSTMVRIGTAIFGERTLK